MQSTSDSILDYSHPTFNDVIAAIAYLPDEEAKALLDWLEDYVSGMEPEEDENE